jgi:hypothetical protein
MSGSPMSVSAPGSSEVNPTAVLPGDSIASPASLRIGMEMAAAPELKVPR